MNCFSPADILLPDFSRVSGEKWAVIACDQFTSEPSYWEAVDQTVADAPSTRRIILPELYLGKNDDEAIDSIHRTMDDYKANLLKTHRDAMILLRRTLPDGRVRRGLIGKIDLECYDYTKGAKSPIRATEGTVLSRIPPRVKVRRGAGLEAPHVMLLIDDPEKTVVEPCDARWNDFAPAYRFPLMAGGGSVEARFLDRTAVADVTTALDALGAKSDLLFAVGDGNHSLASAKAYYEEIKAELGDAAKDHPARYALVEIGNIHDEALEFHPIYRVVFGADQSDLLRFLQKGMGGKKQSFRYVTGSDGGDLALPATSALPVGTLQALLDEYVAAHPDVKVDYIHGEDSLAALAARPGAVGFLFEGMAKSELFPAVIADGALPRKTFSMGEAREKRYYLECRAIR